MIDLVFERANDKILIRVLGRDLRFAKVQGAYLNWTDINGLKFDVNGIIIEFPDLKDKENAEVIRIGKERFREHLKKMKSEEEIKKYLITDLKKHGYIIKYFQRKGHRIVRCPQ